MKLMRTFVTSATTLALVFGVSAPAFAYRNAVPPVATTQLRQRSEIRDLYADAYASILHYANMERTNAMTDNTGRSMLARSQVRAAQRNFRRHVLGYLRGVDYRVLNVAGDMRRGGAGLPSSLVRTGGATTSANHGSWMYDRPTRRDIRENLHDGRTNDRDRNDVPGRN